MIKSPDISKVLSFLPAGAIDALRSDAEYSNALLHTGEGVGADFLGWVNLPSSITPEILAEIKAAAQGLRERAEVVIVIGIGGSYLGAKAILEALGDPFAFLQRERRDPVIVFAGHTISEDYMAELVDAVRDREIATSPNRVPRPNRPSLSAS